MKAIDRVIQIINNQGLNNSSFEKKISVSNGYIAKQVGRSADLGESILMKVLENCPEISPEWLLTGKGEMLRAKMQEHQGFEVNENGSFYAKQKEPILIPLFDTVATAGRQNADLSPVSEPSEYIDAGDWFRDATAAMRVHGDSMHPEYHSGSIIAIKEAVDKRLVVYGQDYVVETTEYRILKRIQKGGMDGAYLACSANTERWDDGSAKGRLIHEPFDILIDDIKKLYLVLGSVRRNHSSRMVYNQKRK